MCIFQVRQLLIMHRLHYVLQLNTYAWLRGAPEKPISDNFKVDETKFVAAQGLAQCQIETGDFRSICTNKDGSYDATGSRGSWGVTSAGRIFLLQASKIISTLIVNSCHLQTARNLDNTG